MLSCACFCFFFILCTLYSLQTYCQKEITKNGKKINRLDKQNKKQDRWFFFDKEENLLMSCDYKDDTLISPYIFYQGIDTVFIRFPRNNDIEVFIIFLDKEQFIGNYRHTKDTSEIEIVGIYHQINKDSFEIKDVTFGQAISQVKDSAQTWLKRKIYPLYMFGNSSLKDFLYGGFHGSSYSFNKPIYAAISVNTSGKVEKIEFPRDKNNLTFEEEAELSRIYSGMPRWQPYFLDGEIKGFIVPFIWSTTLQKIGSLTD